VPLWTPFDDPRLLRLEAVAARAPWLTAHLRALAERQPRPAAEAPQAFKELLDKAWEAANG